MHEPATQRAMRSARHMSLRLSITYAVLAVTWIVVTDQFESAFNVPASAVPYVNTGKGILFVLVTAMLLYSFSRRFLSIAEENHDRYRSAQEQLRLRERSIEQAYIDVLSAVTGGKLILMWPDDVPSYLGEVVMPEERIDAPGQLSAARSHIAEFLTELNGRRDEALLAANEGITNALKHGGGGEYQVRRTPFAIQVVVTDHGPGIDFHTLPRATLIAGYSTKASLGIGFTIMFEVAERILLATRPGLTTLVLEFPLHPRA